MGQHLTCNRAPKRLYIITDHTAASWEEKAWKIITTQYDHITNTTAAKNMNSSHRRKILKRAHREIIHLFTVYTRYCIHTYYDYYDFYTVVVDNDNKFHLHGKFFFYNLFCPIKNTKKTKIHVH